jgi:hypothetical protein
MMRKHVRIIAPTGDETHMSRRAMGRVMGTHVHAYRYAADSPEIRGRLGSLGT